MKTNIVDQIIHVINEECMIISKLGMPCIFIRYNPGSKESNKEILLEKIEEYST
jgi:hypothetical protein